MARFYGVVCLVVILNVATGSLLCDPINFSLDDVDTVVVMDNSEGSYSYIVRAILAKQIACSRPTSFAIEGWHINPLNITCTVSKSQNGFYNIQRREGDQRVSFERTLCSMLETALKCSTKNVKIKDIIVTLGDMTEVGKCDIKQMLSWHHWHLTVFWLRRQHSVSELDGLSNVDVVYLDEEKAFTPRDTWLPPEGLVDELAASRNKFANSLGAYYAEYVKRTVTQRPMVTLIQDTETTTTTVATTTTKLPMTTTPLTTMTTTTTTTPATTSTSVLLSTTKKLQTPPPTTTMTTSSKPLPVPHIIPILQKDSKFNKLTETMITLITDKPTTPFITTSKLASTSIQPNAPKIEILRRPKVPFVQRAPKNNKQTEPTPAPSSTKIEVDFVNITSNPISVMIAISMSDSSYAYVDKIFTLNRNLDHFQAGLLWGAFLALLILIWCLYCCYVTRSSIRGDYDVANAESGNLNKKTKKIAENEIPKNTDTEAMDYCPMPMEFRRSRSFIQRNNVVYTQAPTSETCVVRNIPELLSVSAVNEPMSISTVRDDVITDIPMSSASVVNSSLSDKMRFQRDMDFAPDELTIRPDERGDDSSEDDIPVERY